MTELATSGHTFSPLPLAGGRRRRSASIRRSASMRKGGEDEMMGGRRRAKKVSAKTIRRTLRSLGMRPKGRMVLKGGEAAMGAPAAPAAAAAAAPAGQTAGRRHRRRGGKLSLKMRLPKLF